VVYLRITVHQAVGDDQPFGFMYGIIPRGLVKGGLTDLHCGCFTFNNHNPFTMRVKYHDICSFLQLVETQAAFYLNEGSGKFFFKDQILDEMLSDPFLRCQDQVLFTDFVKDKMLAIF